MSELLLNSLYPRPEYYDNDEGNTEQIIDFSREQIKRCYKFVHTYESAALVFYSNLYKHTSIGSVIKLCVMLWNVLLTQPQQEKSSKSNGKNKPNHSLEDNKSAENENESDNEVHNEVDENNNQNQDDSKLSKKKDETSRTKRRREIDVSIIRINKYSSKLEKFTLT